MILAELYFRLPDFGIIFSNCFNILFISLSLVNNFFELLVFEYFSVSNPISFRTSIISFFTLSLSMYSSELIFIVLMIFDLTGLKTLFLIW